MCTAHIVGVFMSDQLVSQAVRQSLRDVVREWGLMQEHPCVPELTLVQGHALIEVERQGSISVGGLSDVLHLEQSSASRLVSRLVEKGFLLQGTSKTDARERVLTLSRSGKEVLRRLHLESDRRVSSSLELLSPEDRQTVAAGLRLYARALKQARGQGATKLRPIQKKDNSAVAAVIRQVMPEYGADGPGFALHDAEVDEMYQTYSQPKHRYFVLEIEGKVVGGGGVGPLKGSDKNVCELRKMYLLPEARGYGLGEKLLRECLVSAQELGFTSCYLETTSRMIQAQNLYEKLGFKRLSGPLGDTGHCACDRWYVLELIAAQKAVDRANSRRELR